MRKALWQIVAVAVFAAIAVIAIYWNRIGVLLHACPILTCAKQIDLGDREKGETVKANLSLSNSGTAALIIDNIRTNCGCTGLEREKDGVFYKIDQLVVQPHETVELVIRLVVNWPAGGTLRVNVLFQTNDPKHPDFTLTIVVPRVRGGVYTYPTSLNFGVTTIGSSARHVLEVYDDADKPRTIESAISTDEEKVRVRLIKKNGVKSDKGTLVGLLEVDINTKMPCEFNSWIRIALSGEIREPDLVSVTGRVAPIIDAIPAVHYLPRRSTNSLIYSSFCTLRSSNGKTFTISKITSPNGISVTEIESSGDPVGFSRLRINFDPKVGSNLVGEAPVVIKIELKIQDSIIDIGIPVYCTNGDKK